MCELEHAGVSLKAILGSPSVSLPFLVFLLQLHKLKWVVPKSDGWLVAWFWVGHQIPLCTHLPQPGGELLRKGRKALETWFN